MPNLPNGTKGGFEPGLTRLRVRHSTTELPRSIKCMHVHSMGNVVSGLQETEHHSVDMLFIAYPLCRPTERSGWVSYERLFRKQNCPSLNIGLPLMCTWPWILFSICIGCDDCG